MPDISRIVYQVLSQIGSHREARYYFELFNHDDPMRFALIAISHSIAQNSGGQLSSAVSLLYHLGLRPIILHSNQTQNKYMVESLASDDVKVKGISENLMQAAIDLAPVKQAINNKQIPVICGTDVNEDVLAEALSELSKSIEPHKIIILSEQAGLLDDHCRVVSNINLNSSHEQMAAALLTDSNALLDLEQAHQLLKQMPVETSISITNVENLVKELFTYKGAGTLIRIEDEVQIHSEFNPQLKEKISELIQASFNRKLMPDYFAAINLDKLFISQLGTAMAVVLKNNNGIAYLDKFIVTPQAQGVGLGKVIWRKLNLEYKQLYWRARINNPINPWYLRQADSSKREGEWIVFGQNIGADDWPDCIEDALSRTVYMVDD